MGRNWELGFRWRYLGGTPYTPVAVAKSSLKEVWDVTAQGLPDYDRLNSMRLPAYHFMGFRIDKKYFFRKWSLNIYLDIQNVYRNVLALPPYLTVRRDASGVPLTDPANPDSYQTYFIDNSAGVVLSSIGIMVEL